MKKLMVVLGVVSILFFSVVVSDESKEVDPVSLSLGSERFNELGLNKLNQTEKSRLFKFIQPLGDYSYLENSAALYLEKNGWKPMHVVGIFEEGYKKYNVALSNYEMLFIDVFRDAEILEQGVYWVKRSSFRMDVILRDGSVEDYSYEVVEK